jgi:hypothetical protein
MFKNYQQDCIMGIVKNLTIKHYTDMSYYFLSIRFNLSRFQMNPQSVGTNPDPDPSYTLQWFSRCLFLSIAYGTVGK